MPTIRDVAARAEVSTATVSHVLNNTRFVSPETREVVLRAIRDLNYHPSAIARSLTTHKTHTVGMVVSDITNNFFGQMIRGALDTITPFDYTLLLCTTEESLLREEEYLELLFKGKVDGFIAAATSQKWGMLQIVEAFHIPIVFVDRVFDGIRGPHVGVDNEFGAFQAVSHLIEDGHRRIGIVVGPGAHVYHGRAPGRLPPRAGSARPACRRVVDRLCPAEPRRPAGAARKSSAESCGSTDGAVHVQQFADSGRAAGLSGSRPPLPGGRGLDWIRRPSLGACHFAAADLRFASRTTRSAAAQPTCCYACWPASPWATSASCSIPSWSSAHRARSARTNAFACYSLGFRTYER